MASHGAASQYQSRNDRPQKNARSLVHQQPSNNMEDDPWEFEYPWATGLCECTKSCEECCYVLCCYPCFSCHLAWRLKESCWITCCLPGHLAILRTKIRTAFRIQGSHLGDFCITEWCPCCASLQMANELSYRNVMR